MKEQTVLVKRSIEKDGYPKTKGYFVVYLDDLFQEGYYDPEVGNFEVKFGGEWEELESSHWLEEVPLSSLIESSMPTQDKPVLAEITFGGSFKMQVYFSNGNVSVQRAMDGYGNSIPATNVEILR